MLVPTRKQTMTALVLLLAGVSSVQATGALTNFVSADSTLTLQLVRAAAATEPRSASGTVQVNPNTGQLTVQLNQATPDVVYTVIFLTTSTSATPQLGFLQTGPEGSGNLQATLSSGTYGGVFEAVRLSLVQYISMSTAFTIGYNASTSTGQSSASTETGSATTPNNTNQSIFQIQPSSNTINAGAFAKFDIHIVQNTPANVFLVARDVPPDSVAIFAPNVGVANPNFDSSLTIITSADTPPGNYVITAFAILNGKEFIGEVNLQILASVSVTANANTTTVSSATTLAMTVGTDQTQYQPNSTVKIQGQVTDATGSAVADATASIQVDAPTGAELFSTNNVHTDSAGIFQVQVSLTPSSPTGTYTVFTSVTRSGYSSTSTRTTFVVGTSTTPSVIIKAVYAGDSAGNPISTFTAGQTIWVWVVIENIGTTFEGIVWIQVRDPNGVPVQIQSHIVKLDAGETIKDALSVTLIGHPTIGVYAVNALVSDTLISQGGTFLASSETQFALIG